MIDNLCGIIKRAWYLVAFSIFIGCLLGYFFADWEFIDPEILSGEVPPPSIPGFDFFAAREAGYSNIEILKYLSKEEKFKDYRKFFMIVDPARNNVLIFGLLVLPLAYFIHKIFQWVLFGRFK